MQIWNVLHAACWNTGRKSRHKSPSVHHRTTLSGYIFAIEAHIDNRKQLLSSNMSSRCPHNMVNFRPLAAEIVSLAWGKDGRVPASWYCAVSQCNITKLALDRPWLGAPLRISTGFASWQCYCKVLQHWASAKHCGIEQRAPPIFGKATITLGIGPHSSCLIVGLLQY